jgi:hypothetical protein
MAGSFDLPSDAGVLMKRMFENCESEERDV